MVMTATDEIREKSKKIFHDAFQHDDEWKSLTKDQQDTIVRRIERCCHAKTVKECTDQFIPRLWSEPRFIERYSTECYRIVSNIDATSIVASSYLAKKIIRGEVDLRYICDIPNHELNPAGSQDERDELSVRMQQKVNNKYCKDKCRNCGQLKVRYAEHQTKASDELSNFHYKCDGCGDWWHV
jgi:DNA-directed RNA polymerase subunit M/transcription elongation factor TFIIS